MASQVQYRRGTNAQNAAFTGALGEITVDTTNGTLRVHDAITVGGSNIATVAYVTSQISSLSSNSISFGTSSVAVIASGGNIRSNIAGSTVQTISSGLVEVIGNVSAGNVLISGNIVDTAALSIITGSNGNIALAPNGSGIVTVSSALSATGNITGGNLIVGSAGNAVLNFASANLHVTNNNASGNITLFTNFGGSGVVEVFKVLGTGAQGVFANGDITLSGNITDTGPLGINTGSNGNLTLNAGSGSIIINSGILNGQANATGNIGSSTGYFNTVFAKATSAQYADLAEMYVADDNYSPGTVVEFGGPVEITIASTDHSTRVAGVISTNPSYLMNATQTGDHVLPVALTGRVPCQVTGTIAKGDRLVASAIPGVATRLDLNKYEPACIIGKALEAYDSETIGRIEVAVGRF